MQSEFYRKNFRVGEWDRSKYSYTIMRSLRRLNGVGRPPAVNLRRYGGAEVQLTPWTGPKEPKPRVWKERKKHE